MKKIDAIRFRVILSVALILTLALSGAVFFWGYRSIQTTANDVGRRQADADASKDTVNNLLILQSRMDELSDIPPILGELYTTNALPQFEAERSVRTIAQQLGLEVTEVTFVDATNSTTSSSTSKSTTTTPVAPTKSGLISFEFANALTYSQLIRFLDAVEMSIPKLSIQSLTIPEGSTRESLSIGTVLIEIAIQQ